MASSAANTKVPGGIALAEIAKRVGGEVVGDEGRLIQGVCAYDEPAEGAIAFTRETDGEKLGAAAAKSPLGAIIVPKSASLKAPVDGHPAFLKVTNPLAALAQIAPLFYQPPRPAPGISPKSDIHPSVKLGKNVFVGAFAAIGEGAVLEDEVQIHPSVVIYPFVSIGARSVIHAGAVIREHTKIGPGVTVQSGAVVGSEGFGYVADEKGDLQPVPQVGFVSLAGGVEIGSNSCVDRATLGTTSIGANTKLDNLVQVGHNVKIGSNSILCGLTGVAGSVQIGNRVTLAGNVGVADHVKIADGVRVAAKAGITNSILEKGDYAGYPVEKVGIWRRQVGALRKLPRVLKTIKTKDSDTEPDDE